MIDRVHELKTWPRPFQGVWDGRKTHEVRRDDRGFWPGDVLLLREWDPETERHTGRSIRAEIGWKTEPGTWGLGTDVCVLSLKHGTLVRMIDGEAVEEGSWGR